MTIKRFDLVLVDFCGSIGSEQSSVRPAVVVGNDACCMYSPVVIVMPFTTKIHNKSNIPTHKVIESEEGGLINDSLLLGEQPTPIDRARIKKYLGHINSKQNQMKIDEACYDAFFYRKDVS